MDVLAAAWSSETASAGEGLRATQRGLWLATPWPVLGAAVSAAVSAGFFAGTRRPCVVLDAGAGDGRVLGALAALVPAATELVLVGVECDGALAASAVRALDGAAHRGAFPPARTPRVVQGDYLDPVAYPRAGLAPERIDLVFNYPDGNERALLSWLDLHAGPETRLLVLCPERHCRLGREPAWRTSVAAPGEPAWDLAAYTVHPGDRIAPLPGGDL
jgi:hypothetical protein